MPPISVMIKPSSGMCNMHCDYCFYCDEAAKRSQLSYGFMSRETLKNVIRRTLPKAEGAITYAFQGGEPTLRGLEFFHWLLEYEHQYNRNNIPVYNALQTNGYGLNEAWCSFFHENHFLIGLSLDGIPKVHDAFRHSGSGEPTYSRIAQAARQLDDYRVDYNILTVVTPLVCENITEIYTAYQKRGWNYQQYIACLDPIGAKHGQFPYALTPEQYGHFLVELFTLWSTDFEKGRHPYIRQFDNYIGIAAGYQPEACEHKGSCGVQYVVEADGSVFPCDFYMLDEYCLGNFNRDRLDSIDQKRRETGFIERSLRLSRLCRSCRFHWICRGGCQRCRDPIPGTDEYQSYFCKSYQIFFESCLERIQEIAALPPDLHP